VKATDDQGKEIRHIDTQNFDQLDPKAMDCQFQLLDLNPGAKTVTLMFAVTSQRVAEFLVACPLVYAQEK